MEDAGNPWRPEALPPLPSATAAANGVWPPEIPWDPMEFLSRSWSVSAMEVSKAMAPPAGGACGFLFGGGGAIPEEEVSADLELERSMAALTANPPAPFATSATSQLIMERIMSHPGAQQEVSQLTSGRLSHSSGHLNGAGSLSDSPPVSPSNADDVNKYCAAVATVKPQYRGGSKTVGRWLKDRRERKKEEARAQNAQLHATVSVAGVAAAIAAIAAATAAATSQGTAAGKDEQAAKIDMAVVSAATLVAAHCVEAAEAMGAEREHLASVVGSAVNVRTPGDIVTLTAAAATALRGAATLKARALKEVWNVAAVVPVEKGGVAGHDQRRHHQQQKEQQQVDEKDPGSSGELLGEDDFLGLCSQELLAKGTELLKRTRKGALHWKTVSVYLNKTGQVMLKMKSRYAAGTITKKKKNVVADVCKDISAWPGRHLLEGGERRRYFGLKTTERGVIEFECRSQRDYEIWTQGVARLLDIAAGRR